MPHDGILDHRRIPDMIPGAVDTELLVEIKLLRTEIAELKEELVPIKSIISTGVDVMAQYNRLNGYCI